ncbi:MAG TPA: DUF4190 domain-containing protein [Ilumatobacteraceae bacterium]
MERGETPVGWHRDPMGRFEYRYFNGVQWTPDVSINGQRYVDAPMSYGAPPGATARPGRGKAIASFVLAISAVAIGWVPFIFAFAVAAAIAAIVFGILGLKAARLHDGRGRGFAVAGLALSPVALAVCVGGFFFTAAVVREVRDFVDPGPHQLLAEQPCTLANGRATFNGSIRNLDDHTHDYRIFIDFDDARAGAESKSSTVAVLDVAPGNTAPWSSTVNFDGTSVECKVSDVFGPVPFNFDHS